MSANASPTVQAKVTLDKPGYATGPRTPEGKARSSLNALKHGLDSSQVVIAGETADGFASYRADMVRALRPYDVPEQDQLEAMILCQWRLRRLWRQEPRIYDAWQDKLTQEDTDGAAAFLNDCKEHQAFTRLGRLERGWLRSYREAAAQLRLLQDQRRKHLRTIGDPVTADTLPSSGTPISETAERTPQARREPDQHPQTIRQARPEPARTEPAGGARSAAAQPATHSSGATSAESAERTPRYRGDGATGRHDLADAAD